MTEYITRASGLDVPRSASDYQFTERIAELEFSIEDQDWLSLANSGSSSTELSRQSIGSIIRLARIMFLKNPLVLRGVTVGANYVFGRGVNISAKQDELKALINAFLEDHENQVELTSQQARIQKDTELRTDGNLFLAFFIHEQTGHIRVRSIPALEIVDIISDPNDKRKVWYYKRQYAKTELNRDSGVSQSSVVTEYYPDWRYSDVRIGTIGQDTIVNIPIYHIQGPIKFSDWQFAVSEVYAAIDWAKAYKHFLENWSTIVDSYARYTWKVSTQGGTRGIAAAKAKLGSTFGTTGTETVPPPVAASTFIRGVDSNGVARSDIEPMRTAGATTSADDARRLLLMVAAAFGLPESFFGDVQGTYATASTLDRPTELAFVNRQTLWSDVYHDIFDYVIFHAVNAPQGPLVGFATIVINEYGERVIKFRDDFNNHIDIDFPPILVHSQKEQMDTLQVASNYVPDAKVIARIALTILGENDIDEMLDTMFDSDNATLQLAPTVEALRESIVKLTESLH